MNVSELQNLVNYRRRDVTESFVSNDEILAYLKEGNRKVGTEYEFEWQKTSTTFTYTDGYIRYALSAIASDFNEPINLFYNYNYYFDIVSPEDFMRLSAGTVDMWSIDGDYLLAKTSFGTGDITMNYYSNYLAKTSAGYWLTNLSVSTDEPLMPETYQDMLVDFAAARCYQKEGMYDDYKIAYSEFMAAMNKLKTSTPSRKRRFYRLWNSPRKVTGTGVADKTDPLNNLN